MTAPSTLVELGELIRTRPGLHTPREQVAAWYERKAVVLHHIADETGDPTAEQCSQRAHARAADLVARNALIGGMPGQGKAAPTRAALVGSAVPGGEVTRR